MKIESYKDLVVWKKSIEMVDCIYIITRNFPQSEMYALASQMQRAAISIPSNIAEGYSRNNLREYLRYLNISYSSASELETQIIIANRQYPEIDYTKANLLLSEILKMLYVLTTRLKTSLLPKP